MSEFTLAASDWLLRVLAVGAGVLLMGWLAVRASRTAATRRRIAAAAVRAALLAPPLCCLPAWLSIPVPVAGPGERSIVERPAPVSRPLAFPVEVPFEPVAVEVPQTAPGAAPEAIPEELVSSSVAFDWRLVLLVVHATISLGLLVQLVRGHLVLRRLWREARPLPGRLATQFDRPCADVRVCDRIESAVCFGFLRPRVLLPLKFARTANATELRWVAAHEFDHARRRDHRAAYWVGLCRAVYFAAPWFWLLRRDLRLAQEYLADAAAARTEPAEYAAFLVELSVSGPFRPHRVALAATGVGATRSELYRRVTMLLNERSASRRPSRLWAGVVMLAVLVVAVLASAVGVTAAPADEPKLKAKAAEPDNALPKPLPADPLDPTEFRKKLTDLLRNGNPDPNELRQLIEQMNEQMAEQLKQRLGRGGFQFQGLPNGAFNPFAPAVPAKPALREQYEKRLKQFDEDIAKNADNADAQAALKKAREAYVEAMAAELKKADEAAKKNPPAPGGLFPNLPNIPFGGGNIEVIPFPAFPNGQDLFGGRAGSVRPRATVLGVQVEKPTPALIEQLDLPADTGLVVTAVVAGSSADKAGLKKSDVVVKVAGKAAPSDAAAFAELLSKLNASEKFDIDLIRKGKKETVKGVELSQPKKPAAGKFGGQGFNQMQVQVNNGDVSIQATADGVTFDITGSVEDGKVVPSKIVVEDGEKKEYPSLDKVPEKHRATVEKLLGQVRAFGGREE